MTRKLPARHSRWLGEPGLVRIFDAIEAAGGEVRVNGGAVRNSLMGLAAGDVDLSTTLEPQATYEALEAAGIRAVDTGMEHGTVTAVSGGRGYEITSLREDVETFGRHARVEFGTDWEADARRRDLTMNALYCGRDGVLFDPLDGLGDVRERRIRFIGDAEARIREDYLRILRFFRFFAHYGHGRPDAEGLKAAARLKEGLAGISVERLWSELRKLLSAKDPGRALLWMRQASVLTQILPESEKWGIDLVPGLIAAEASHRWKPDPMLRLMAMIRPDAANVAHLAKRLKMSGAERTRLTGWALCDLPAGMARDGEWPGGEAGARKALYRGDREAIADCLKLAIAGKVNGEGGSGGAARGDKVAEQLETWLRFVQRWKRPVFPLKGKDLAGAGFEEGPAMGNALRVLENAWVESGFTLKKRELLNAARALGEAPHAS